MLALEAASNNNLSMRYSSKLTALEKGAGKLGGKVTVNEKFKNQKI